MAVVSGFRRLADADQRIADQIAAVDRRVARLEGTIDTLQSVLLSCLRPPAGSNVWRLRERFLKEQGDIGVDLELPPRNGERFENPF